MFSRILAVATIVILAGASVWYLGAVGITHLESQAATTTTTPAGAAVPEVEAVGGLDRLEQAPGVAADAEEVAERHQDMRRQIEEVRRNPREGLRGVPHGARRGFGPDHEKARIDRSGLPTPKNTRQPQTPVLPDAPELDTPDIPTEVEPTPMPEPTTTTTLTLPTLPEGAPGEGPSTPEVGDTPLALPDTSR